MERFEKSSSSGDRKVAVLPGSSRSLGLHIARLLLHRRARVVICDVNPELDPEAVEFLGECKEEESFLYMQCKSTRLEDLKCCFKMAIETFGRLDIVVNSLGIAYERGRAHRRIVDINFGSFVESTYAGLDLMSKENGGQGGTIVNVGSTTALEESPLLPIYSSTKAAVNQFSRSIGSDYHFKKTGVKVIAVNPPITSQDYLLYSKQFLAENAYVLNESIIPIQSAAHSILWVMENAQSGTLWVVLDSEAPKLITSTLH